MGQEKKKKLYEILFEMKELAEQGKVDELKILNLRFSPLYISIFHINDFS
ncbi:MAG: hypothetical protein QT11_C0001G0831 [archaeon GW2011_AR20]|nr:MAG: hypothetical protein QT11_C0001G0831 [archaeon GW2011_AR20]MBS3160763.1 hypothetical protein [Candidatus Woesearchaeota archaeon]